VFCVGFGRAELSPKGYSAKRADYPATDGVERMSQGILDPIYFTCVAITDAQGNTALICTTDQLGTMLAEVNSLRSKVNEAYGIPKENLVVSATHTHSSPMSGNING